MPNKEELCWEEGRQNFLHQPLTTCAIKWVALGQTSPHLLHVCGFVCTASMNINEHIHQYCRRDTQGSVHSVLHTSDACIFARGFKHSCLLASCALSCFVPHASQLYHHACNICNRECRPRQRHLTRCDDTDTHTHHIGACYH